jgi:hypothetical protein
MLRSSYLSLSKTRGKINALSGETIFLGRSDVDSKWNFTGVSFLWEHKDLTQAAHFLNVEATESV